MGYHRVLYSDLLFINDLARATNLSTFLFADDTTFQPFSRNISQLLTVANKELEGASL